MNILGCKTLSNGCIVEIKAGSVLDFCGDAIVNAANTGGVTGFGLDEAVNRAAGDVEIKEARRQLKGIQTGEAKWTPSFHFTNVKTIIHAVGPVYRENSLQKGTEKEKDYLLSSAYANAIERAIEVNATTVGFSLISAGVFRGDRSLEDVITIGLTTIFKEMRPPITVISVYAYTEEEQAVIADVFEKLEIF